MHTRNEAYKNINNNRTPPPPQSSSTTTAAVARATRSAKTQQALTATKQSRIKIAYKFLIEADESLTRHQVVFIATRKKYFCEGSHSKRRTPELYRRKSYLFRKVSLLFQQYNTLHCTYWRILRFTLHWERVIKIYASVTIFVANCLGTWIQCVFSRFIRWKQKILEFLRDKMAWDRNF